MRRQGEAALRPALGFPGGSAVKNPPATAGKRRFDPWVGKIT